MTADACPSYPCPICGNGVSPLNSGFIYAPYIPLVITRTIVDGSDLTQKNGIMTRYGKKLSNADYYGILDFVSSEEHKTQIFPESVLSCPEDVRPGDLVKMAKIQDGQGLTFIAIYLGTYQNERITYDNSKEFDACHVFYYCGKVREIPDNSNLFKVLDVISRSEEE